MDHMLGGKGKREEEGAGSYEKQLERISVYQTFLRRKDTIMSSILNKQPVKTLMLSAWVYSNNSGFISCPGKNVTSG